MTTERAILANGCFWGSQELLRHLPGVISTRTGYSGDPATPNATYRRHGDRGGGRSRWSSTPTAQLPPPA